MNKRTHIKLGQIIYRFAEEELGVQLFEGSFLFGNILPDIYFSFVTRPHTVEHTLGLVNKKIRKLMNMKQKHAYIGRRFSRRLGVICHYYADFFCYPHTSDYTGDLKDHVRYEKALHRYLNDAYGAADAQTLCGGCLTLNEMEDAETCLMRYQNEYIKSKPTFDLDLSCAILVCTQSVYTIAGAASEQNSEKQTGFEPILHTA